MEQEHIATPMERRSERQSFHEEMANTQQGYQQMFPQSDLMLGHRELIVGDLLPQVYVVDREMAQEMLDLEIQVYLVLACLRLLQSV